MIFLPCDRIEKWRHPMGIVRFEAGCGNNPTLGSTSTATNIRRMLMLNPR